ncbi:MAG: ABC transporter permease [Verrucomicrobia bacterium]|nr:ABC transporter permease [Verrucomicrobiota bacterium]
MNLPYEFFICLRYLKPKRAFASVITLISLAGVMLGVAVLIVVIAVMSGFDRDLRAKILEMNAHIIVTNGGILDHSDKVIKTMLAVPGMKAASPYVWGPVLIEFDRKAFTPYVKGIDPTRDRDVTALERFVRRGKYDLDGQSVIVGNELARQFNINPGDKITVYSPRNFQQRKEVYLPMELTVNGIFDSGLYEYDLGIIFTSVTVAQELYNLGPGVHEIAAMVEGGDEPKRCQAAAKLLGAQLKAPLRVETWMQRNKKVLMAVQVEKNVMFFILFFIIVVAAFGICSTLITITIQKTREIGVLKAVGAGPLSIMSIFVLQGFVVGVIGTLLGLGAGMLLLHYRNPFNHWLSGTLGYELFPREIYNFSEIPAQINAPDVAWICVTALVICTVAGIVPALRAARLDPVEALRYE